MSAELIQNTTIARPNIDGFCTRTEMMEGLFINLAEALTLNNQNQIGLLSQWINQIMTQPEHPFYFWSTEDNETWKPTGFFGANRPESYIFQ